MKRKFIPVLALTALLGFGAISTTLVSCGGAETQKPQKATISINSGTKNVVAGEEITLTCTVAGTTDTSVTWSIIDGNENVELVDAKAGKFKGLKEGTADVKVALDSDASVFAVTTINVLKQGSENPDVVRTIAEVTKTMDSSLVPCTVEGTIVSLFEDWENHYTALIYDGTGYIQLYCFTTKADEYKVGDVVRVQGTPSRTNNKSYYWIQFNLRDQNDITITKSKTPATSLPEAETWDYAKAAAYTETDGTSGKHVIVEAEAYASGDFINYKILTGNTENKTDRALTLQFTPNNEAYTKPGTKVVFEGITGDLKNGETLVLIYPIKIEVKGLAINGEGSVNVGKTTQLTLMDGEKEVTTGITWDSENKDIATVSDKGLVTGVKAGEATIKATYNNETVTFKILVLENTVAGEAIKGTIKEAKEAIIAKNYDQTLLYEVEGTVKAVENAGYGRYTITDGAGNDLKVYGSRIENESNKALSYKDGLWDYDYNKGDDPTSAAVIGKKLTLHIFGKTSKNYKNFYGVIIKHEDIATTNIAIDNKETTMKVNETLQLTYNRTPELSSSPVTFESSAPEIISVTEEGELKALKEGEATITAKVSDTVKDSITITVSGTAVVLPTHTFTWAKGMGTIADKNLTIVDGDFNVVLSQDTSNSAVKNEYAEFRIYQGHKLTISSETKKITKIEYTTVGGKNGAVTTTDAATITNAANDWTIKANDEAAGLSSISLKASAQLRVQEIKITYLA